MDDRTAEIIAEAKSIASLIEDGAAPLSRIALRARRLAQMLDDDAIIMWLSLECTGHDGVAPPERPWRSGSDAERGLKKFLQLRAVPDFTKVTAMSLAQRVLSGKPPERTQALGASLAALEAMPARTQKEMGGLGPDATAMATLIMAERNGILGRVANAIHEWATNVYIVHRFRQLAGNIFDRFKTNSDIVLAALCPDAISKLNIAIERAGSGNPEDWAAAALACRRVLRDFADSVYPARNDKVEGRAVGPDEYKNRIWAFAKERGRNEIDRQALALEEIEGLGKALDRIYDQSSKGVHSDISRPEAEMLILRTYVLLSQLARLAQPPSG